MYRTIKPELIRAKRGDRTRRAIIEDVPGLTEQDIYAYEKGEHKPSEKKLPALLKALDCTFEEISEPVNLVSA